MLYIDPDSCIDCEACAVECPTSAIFPEDQVPETDRPFIELNREMAQTCPMITEPRTPLTKR